jgi:hypothetical protein
MSELRPIQLNPFLPILNWWHSPFKSEEKTNICNIRNAGKTYFRRKFLSRAPTVLTYNKFTKIMLHFLSQLQYPHQLSGCRTVVIQWTVNKQTAMWTGLLNCGELLSDCTLYRLYTTEKVMFISSLCCYDFWMFCPKAHFYINIVIWNNIEMDVLSLFLTLNKKNEQYIPENEGTIQPTAEESWGWIVHEGS